ncbi:MAG: threonine ammonia-lyase, biosynthetic, partial [Dokdonella sp.]
MKTAAFHRAAPPIVAATAPKCIPLAEATRVYEVARRTALEPAPLLSARIDRQVWLKREDQQSVFSFKLRGAYNKMAKLDA